MAQATCPVDWCDREPTIRGYCKRCYYRLRARGELTVLTTEERFWLKVDKAGPLPAWAPFLGPCWLWTGVPTWKGYGQLRVNGRKLAAHRLSYTLNVGPIPEGLHIDHLCRLRHRVNPSHLEAVTPEENWRRGFAPSAVAARAS